MKININSSFLKHTIPVLGVMLFATWSSAMSAALVPMPDEDSFALVAAEESAEDIARKVHLEMLREQAAQAQAIANYYRALEERLTVPADEMTEEERTKKNEATITMNMMGYTHSDINHISQRIARQYNNLIMLAEVYDANKRDLSITQIRTIVEGLAGKAIKKSMLEKKQIERATDVLLKGKIIFHTFNIAREKNRFPFLVGNEEAAQRQWKKISNLISAAFATLKAIAKPADDALLLSDEPTAALEA